MIQVRITGVRRPVLGPFHHSAITHYRWESQAGEIKISDRMTFVNWILENPKEHFAYVKDYMGNIAYCKVVRNQFGTIFLETYPDFTNKDNLLNLPQV